MPDDSEIQYLGTNARSSAHILPFLSSSPRPVTGVTLHVEANGIDAGYSFTLRKSEAAVVQIGRRPGTSREAGDWAVEAGKVFFSCAVVSRIHCKLVFSDSGQLYIVDSNSHHGTHIRKPGETVSNKIDPDRPVPLVDGAVVTFGKSVGSDIGLVRPIVARIAFEYAPHSLLKPLVVPMAAAIPPFRSLSGRYGVIPAASDASSDSDDGSHDSDIEEIPRPSRPPWHADNNDSVPSPQQRADILAAIRSFSPNDDFLCSPEPQDELLPHFSMPSDSYYERAIFGDTDDEEDEDNLSDNSDDGNYSRSTSSMDLASSPEPSGEPIKENVVPVGEPIIIGAWPRSRSSSPSIFSSSFPPIRILPPVKPAEVVAPIVNEPASPKSRVFESMDEESEEEEDVVNKGDNDETAKLKSSLAVLKADVAKLQAHRRKYKQRFNDNIKIMGDKFSDLEDRTSEVEGLYHFLSDKVDENVDACQQAQAQVDVLQLDMFRVLDAPEKAAPDAEELAHIEEAKVNAKKLEELVAEMTELRETVKKEMEDELQSARAAKEALQSLTQQVLAQTASLKRKRAEDEAEVSSETAPQEPVVEVTTAPPRKRVRRVAKALVQTATYTAVGAVVCWSALAFS